MRNFIDAVRQCLATRNYYGALTISLTLPDMCGALADPNAGSKARFSAFWEKYCLEKYSSSIGSYTHVFLGASDAYALRCAVLHEGVDDVSKHKAREALDKYHFVQPERGMFHCNQSDRHLNLQVDIFCGDILDGVEAFLRDTANDVEVASRIDAMVSINDMRNGFRM